MFSEGVNCGLDESQLTDVSQRSHAAVVHAERDFSFVSVWHWLSEVFLSPHNDFHYRIVSVLNAAWMISDIQCCFIALSFLCAEICPNSLNPLMVLCTADNKIPRFFASCMLRNIRFKIVSFLPVQSLSVLISSLIFLSVSFKLHHQLSSSSQSVPHLTTSVLYS